MAFSRNRAKAKKQEIEGLDRVPVREQLFQLKPGRKRYKFPIRPNTFYQLGIQASYRNLETNKVTVYGKDTGRYATGDYIFSRQSQKFDYDAMMQECIGFGYNRANVPAGVRMSGDTNPFIHEGTVLALEKVSKVFVLIKRNVKTTNSGMPRKVKPFTIVESASWKKAQLKKIADKKAAQKAKKAKKPVVVRKEKVTLNKLKALHQKAKTSAEREKYRKAIWNKQHPRKR